VLAGRAAASDTPAQALLASLTELGVETIYLGKQDSARRIASVVADEQADSVELCLAGSGGVVLLRDLLRELIELGRRDVSIVAHRGLGRFESGWS